MGMHEEQEGPNRFAQFETQSSTPGDFRVRETVTAQDAAYGAIDATQSWPMVIYVLPTGEVIARRELTTAGAGVKWANTYYANQSQMVLKVWPHREPGPSDGGGEFRVEVLKCRLRDIEPLMQSIVAAHLESPDSAKVPDEDDLSTHPIDCTCIYCVPGV
jgi:hypothetical protein